jgi:hypothetical protein
MDDAKAEVRRDLEQTRERMSRTVDELVDRIAEPMHAVRARLDVGRQVRAHPWLALGVALGAGVLLSSTGADAAAARATGDAARRAGSAAKDGTLSLVDRLRRDRGEEVERAELPKPGLLDRLGDRLAEALAGPLHELADEVRRATEEWGRGGRAS